VDEEDGVFGGGRHDEGIAGEENRGLEEMGV